ncbi:hypothetical protein J6590_039528 [Homalodisca vitripennis]|nr:hypothetical protein J6590_039528 [Homalodisca vitripennis]
MALATVTGRLKGRMRHKYRSRVRKWALDCSRARNMLQSAAEIQDLKYEDRR